MSTKWRIVDLLGYRGFVGYARGNLDLDGSTVPLDQVSCILLGQGATWGYGLVAAAERFDVQVIIADWRQIPVGILNHTSPASRVGARQRAQAAMKSRTKEAGWRRVVKAKIEGQSAVLELHASEASARHLRELSRSVGTSDASNLEAAAARYYWERFLAGFRRNRTSGDFVNRALNYGYTILRGSVLAGISAAGLLPSLGLHHGSATNAFPLADDLIEPFRPAVDDAVLHLVKGGASSLDSSVKSNLAGLLENNFPSEEFRLRTKIQTFCLEYGMYVERERSALHVPVWRGH